MGAQFAKYVSIAIGSAIVDWVVFFCLNWFFAQPVLAQMASRLAGGVYSFSLNRSWSFRATDTRQLTTEGRRFLILYALSYMLSVGILFACVTIFETSAYYTKLVADGSCLLFNFIVMRVYVFHSRSGVSQLMFRMKKVFEKPT